MARRGFTLIELLMSITIIGILAAIVTVQIGASRNKADDTKVKAQVYEVKNAAEIYFGVNQNYGPANISQASGGTSCTGSLFTDPNSGVISLSKAPSYPGGTNLICVQNSNHFAFAASLSSGDYWCVDSVGSPGLIEISDLNSITDADLSDSCPELDGY